MSKNLLLLVLFYFSGQFMVAQEETNDAEIDSLVGPNNEKGIVVIDSSIKQKKILNPLAPSKAAFYSAVIPGLGQIYNKRYWKVPLVFGAIGGGIYGYTFYDNQYNQLRTAFKRRKAGFTDDEFFDLRPDDGITNTVPDIDDERLERLQNDRQNDRDLMLLVTIIIYSLNIVDANVDAHLKQFNISDDLSLDFNLEPYLEMNPITSNPHYGMAFKVKF